MDYLLCDPDTATVKLSLSLDDTLIAESTLSLSLHPETVLSPGISV